MIVAVGLDLESLSLDLSLCTHFVLILSRWKDVSGAVAVLRLVFNVFPSDQHQEKEGDKCKL